VGRTGSSSGDRSTMAQRRRGSMMARCGMGSVTASSRSREQHGDVGVLEEVATGPEVTGDALLTWSAQRGGRRMASARSAAALEDGGSGTARSAATRCMNRSLKVA
jgi:hypothetical protein